MGIHLYSRRSNLHPPRQSCEWQTENQDDQTTNNKIYASEYDRTVHYALHDAPDASRRGNQEEPLKDFKAESSYASEKSQG